MKKSLFVLFMLMSTLSFSQFEIGLKAGVSSPELSPESILIPNSIIIGNGGNTSEISIADAKYGYHLGLYTRISIANIFIEPSFLFNSASVDYNLEEQIFDTGVISTIANETYNNLDIPLMVGIKLGFFRLQGGPVAHIFLDSASDLTNFSGYRQKFKDATYGVQGGIGVDFWKIRLDLNYETQLSEFGGEIIIDGETYQFDQRPSRLIASVGYRF